MNPVGTAVMFVVTRRIVDSMNQTAFASLPTARAFVGELPSGAVWQIDRVCTGRVTIDRGVVP